MTVPTDPATLLAELIALPTHNPGGDELALCARLAELLDGHGADEVEVVTPGRKHGGPGGYVWARFGRPRTILNAHLDTVPPNTGWTRDPFRAEITADAVFGLGACDIKGAIAAALCALEAARPQDFGILFSGDEERGANCVKSFLASPRAAGIERAVICEPTRRAVGVRHRGVRAYKARFRGAGGHSSKADFMPKPLVTLARLAVALDDQARRWMARGTDEMKGLCTNVARLDGGVAFNVVPDAAELLWSLRPPPGFDAAAYADELAALTAAIDPAIEVELITDHEPFACPDDGTLRALLGPSAGPPVALDFWTEAALMAGAGIEAVVVGPGDIAMAHAPDEQVPRADLAWAVETFTHLFQASGG
jgi:acetylornithine deacetylase